MLQILAHSHLILSAGIRRQETIRGRQGMRGVLRVTKQAVLTPCGGLKRKGRSVFRGFNPQKGCVLIVLFFDDRLPNRQAG